jgi:hypothetical protein
VHHLVDDRLHGGRVGDVKTGGTRVQRRRCPFGRVAVDVGADHIGPGTHQRAAQRRADTGPGAGDDCLLARETH